jgi:pSer/pThr/pTyr-binding forkhead associated (FHA) protein
MAMAMAPAAYVPPAQMTGPRLEVLTGPRTGQVFLLRHGFMIGRTPGCDIVLDDGTTSGYHTQFLVDGTGASVMDLNSANGTWINGQRTVHARLADGTVIRVGQTDVKYIAR